MRLAANRTWFNFRLFSQNADFGVLSVYSFTGAEKVSLPYKFSIELVNRDANLNITAALGKEALAVWDRLVNSIRIRPVR